MIEIRNLRKEYPNVQPLRDVNADIHDGDVISVIGPSGTGKSTFLRCINLLDQPDGGSIKIDGEEILSPSCDRNRIRKKMGMIFQSFNLFENVTAIENIMYPQMDLLGRSKQEAYDASIKLLRRMGIMNIKFSYPDELSGGEKQRVAIARALALDPSIILFDEPTSSMDPAMTCQVETVIKDLAREGKTMIITTHEMSFARAISNRVFFLDQGVICEEGTPDQIFNHPQKDETRRFIRKLKVLEIEIKDADFDFPAAYGEIDSFCRKNHIPSRIFMRIQLVFEELIQQILLPKLPEPDLLFSVEYSDALEEATVMVDYKGEPLDLDSTDNRLAFGMLRGAASEMDTRPGREGEANTIFLKIE